LKGETDQTLYQNYLNTCLRGGGGVGNSLIEDAKKKARADEENRVRGFLREGGSNNKRRRTGGSWRTKQVEEWPRWSYSPGGNGGIANARRRRKSIPIQEKRVLKGGPMDSVRNAVTPAPPLRGKRNGRVPNPD